jgi:hypothetical protein
MLFLFVGDDVEDVEDVEVAEAFNSIFMLFMISLNHSVTYISTSSNVEGKHQFEVTGTSLSLSTDSVSSCD